MKNLIIVCGILFFSLNLSAQKFSSKNGFAGFYSHTPMEDVKADNNQVNSILDSSTGDIVFLLLNKSFHFDRALMEEHFNENYIESNKYPKSTFKGTVSDISKVNFSSDGNYPVTVNGDLTIHGVTKNVTASGNIIIKGGKITISSKFMAKLADYGISIPGAVKSNISESVEIAVNCNLDQKM